MKRSRQVVLAITSTVVLAACDRAGEPRPPQASIPEPPSALAGSEVTEAVSEPGSGASLLPSTNGASTSASRPYSGSHSYFYPGYHVGRPMGSAPISSASHATPASPSSGIHPSGSQPAHSSDASSASHGSVSRGGFGAHGSSHASAAS